MPNHVHGILILNNKHGMGNDLGNDSADVQTGHALSLSPPTEPQNTPGQLRFQNQGKKHHFIHYRRLQIGGNQTL